MRACEHTRENSWWVYDARGIPLVRVCASCKDEQLKRYRPEVLTDGNYEADEPIEDEEAGWDIGVYRSDFGPDGQL